MKQALFIIKHLPQSKRKEQTVENDERIDLVVMLFCKIRDLENFYMVSQGVRSGDSVMGLMSHGEDRRLLCSLDRARFRYGCLALAHLLPASRQSQAQPMHSPTTYPPITLTLTHTDTTLTLLLTLNNPPSQIKSLFNPVEEAFLICRIGYLNTYNPIYPEGWIEVDIKRREERQVGRD